MKNFKNTLGVLALYFISQLIFFRNILFSPGVIIGYDWGLPATLPQMNKAFSDSFITWADQGNYLGNRVAFFAALPFHSFIKLMSLLGIDGTIYTKLMLIIIPTLAGFSMYLLARKLHFSKVASFFAGIFYITTPLFFNYAIMGWEFVLISLVLMPLSTITFITAVKEGKVRYAIVTGIIYAVSMLQSQSLLWLMILFLGLSIYLISDRQTLKNYLKTMLVIIFLFFLLNSYWILGLLIAPDTETFGSDIVNSTTSLGSVFHMKPLNIVRLWGSLANIQFEYEINQHAFSQFLSFLGAFLAVFALQIKARKRLVISLWLLALVPIAMMVFNNYRNLLLLIPFSNGIRDFARFTTVSTFAYAILSALTIEYFIKKKSRLLLACIFVLFALSIYPWWTADISHWKVDSDCHGRMRAKVFPQEYNDLEQQLSKKKFDHKIFYIPTGGIIAFSDDHRFQGICNDAWDIYSGFSPVPGSLGLTDRGRGYLTEFIAAMVKNLDDNIIPFLNVSDVKSIIVRKNLLRPEQIDMYNNIKTLSKEGILSKQLENKNIVVFDLPNFLPHFYIPRTVIVSDQSVSALPTIISATKNPNDTAVLFTHQNKKNNLTRLREPIVVGQLPTIEYKKIAPYKYRVYVHNVTQPFELVFSESFHDRWKAYLTKNQSSRLPKPGTGGQAKFKVQNFENKTYPIPAGNDKDQATKDEVESFASAGLISTFGDKPSVDFISKKFHSTIQNQNLPSGKVDETWFLKTLHKTNMSEIDTQNHHLINGYANAWFIDPVPLCTKTKLCTNSGDNAYDMELIVEFWPQRVLLAGAVLSGVALVSSIVLIVIDYLREKKSTITS